jgi:hypothetical protein
MVNIANIVLKSKKADPFAFQNRLRIELQVLALPLAADFLQLLCDFDKVDCYRKSCRLSVKKRKVRK